MPLVTLESQWGQIQLNVQVVGINTELKQVFEPEDAELNREAVTVEPDNAELNRVVEIAEEQWDAQNKQQAQLDTAGTTGGGDASAAEDSKKRGLTEEAGPSGSVAAAAEAEPEPKKPKTKLRQPKPLPKTRINFCVDCGDQFKTTKVWAKLCWICWLKQKHAEDVAKAQTGQAVDKAE